MSNASSITFMTATPNLIVSDMPASVTFYRDVLKFGIERTVPDEAPYVFVWLKRGSVELFLNEMTTVAAVFPNLRAGGTSTLYVVVDDVKGLMEEVTSRAQIAMPMTDQFYGMREFAIFDPDGYLITFAQRIAVE